MSAIKPESTSRKPKNSAAARQRDASLSRSELIRRRRTGKSIPSGTAAQPAARRKKAPAAHRDGPPAPPPVMARGSVANPFDARRSRDERSVRRQRARRNYNIAVGSQGAEMRLPSLPGIHFGWRLASFILTAVLAFGLYQLWNAPLYRVDEDSVQIHGLQRLSSAAVRPVLAVENQPVFVLDTQLVQKNLLGAFPELSSAQVGIELPNTVVVTVTERVPVLIWLQDGRSNLIDSEGMLFPLRDENVQTNFPVVEASATPPAPPVNTTGEGETTVFAALPARPFLFPEMVTAILSLAANAPEGAVITYDARHGLCWKDRRGWYVYFGDVLGAKNGDIEMKLRVYKSILEYLKAQDTKPSLISVEYVHAPYYRLAGASGD